MQGEQWKHRIGSGKGPVIVSFFMLAIFGGLTFWLYNTKNGAYFFTGLLSVIMLLIFGATIHRLLFYKVLINDDGFYYQTGIGNGRYYSYDDVEKAWISSGTAMNGGQQEFCNISLSNNSVIRFQFFYIDSDAVDYLIEQTEKYIRSTEVILDENRTYTIDGKVFGKTKIVVGIVLALVVAIVSVIAAKSLGRIYPMIPGMLIALGALIYIVKDVFFFKVVIDRKYFYVRTNPFNGQQYFYEDIAHCQEIKKVFKVRSHYGDATDPKYYFFFEFTEKNGKKHKFLFEKPIHEHEINILKERILANK